MTPLSPVLRGILLFFIVNYAVLIAVYLLLDTFFIFVEPGLISASWLVATGLPVYVDPGSAAQYSFIYGPVLFLVNALAFQVFGPGILVGKLASGLFALGSVGLVYLAARGDYGRQAGLVAGGALVLIYFIFWPFGTFIARADALILGFVALGLWGGTLRRPLAAAVVVGLAAGLAANVKVHSAVYFLPFAALVWQRHGLRWVIATGVVSVLALVAPFALDSQVSVAGYLATMNKALQHGLLWEFLLHRTQQFVLFLGLPTLLVWLVVERLREQLYAWRWFLAALGLSVVATILISLHAGSTAIFLAPLAVSFAYWYAALLDGSFAWSALRARSDWAARWRRWVGLGLFVVAVLTVVPVNLRMVKLVQQEDETDAVLGDLRSIMREHPQQKVAMGYGTNEHSVVTWYRPVLAFAGNPYLIDESTMLDLVVSNKDLPEATFNAIATCRVDIWLVPRGDPPFDLANVIGPGKLFSDRFRRTFREHYEPRESSRFFDLWFCKGDAAGPPPTPARPAPG